MKRRSPPPPYVLSVAGSDPSGCAGLQADLQTFAMLGCAGGGVVAAHTVQNGSGVFGVSAVAAETLLAQAEALLKGPCPAALKTGMLGDGRTLSTLMPFFRELASRGARIVIDPVTRSSSGYPLLDEEGVTLLLQELAPLCTVIVPNLPELCVASGITESDNAEVIENAAHFWLRHAPAVLVTGGHMSGDLWCTDTLYRRDRHTVSFGMQRVPGGEKVRGTGCGISAALACSLAHDLPLERAIWTAKNWLTNCIKESYTGTDGIRRLSRANFLSGPARMD